MTQISTFVGIDVAKAHLDVCVLPDDSEWRIANDSAGIEEMVARLAPLGESALVVLEATNRFWQAATVALQAAGLHVAVIDPRRSRSFATSMNMRAKTDRIDARMLAKFARNIRPEPTPIAAEAHRFAAELVGRRAQLVRNRVAETNRLGSAVAPEVREDIVETIAFIDQRIAAIDAKIEQAMTFACIDSRRIEIIDSFKGIAKQTAQTLEILAPELGSIGGKQAAALLGVAPYARDSGASQGKRSIGGGRADLRSALYMPTITAIRCNPVIRTFYQRLVAAGKAKKVAIIACMRKLIVTINAMLREQQLFMADQKNA